METVLKACMSSISDIVSSTGSTGTTKEWNTSAPPGMTYAILHLKNVSNERGNQLTGSKPFSSRGHQMHFAPMSVTSTYNIPCKFPSTPLPCSGSLCKDLAVKGDIKEETTMAPSWGRDSESSPHPEISLPAITTSASLPIACSPMPLSTCSNTEDTVKGSRSKGEIRWIRALGYAERFMTVAGRWGNMSTVYALWLDSRGPISFEAIQTTSQLMFRKMPHLRLCIGRRRSERWWREMDTHQLDIDEIQSDDDVLEVFESLLKRSYNITQGPLWFVRFLTSVNRNDLVRDSNFNLKHKYVLIFGFHHNFSDGTTNMKFCDVFISLLNDVLKNNVVDVKEEGRFAFPIHDNIANATLSYTYLLKVFTVRIYKGIIAYCEYVKNFLRHYPMPNEQDACTRVLQSELDEISTERLLKRCKMEGVSLNSTFTAAANIGMLRMILQRDGAVDETRFDSQQAINMRRYWPKDKRSQSYGCHISMVDIQIPTKKEDITNFWEYARKVHSIISKELYVEKRTLKIQPLCEKLWLAIFVNFLMSKFRLPSTNDSHYCITNMGDVSTTFSGEGAEVNVYKILRSVSCHFMQALCQHTLQTFRGKFYYSLDYYPQKMDVGTARAYASSLMDTLRTIIHQPN